MKSTFAFVCLVFLFLAQVAAAQDLSLSCTARGAEPTATGRHPETVRNGDFRVTGNASYPEIGDSLNERTRWTCDLGGQIGAVSLESYTVETATLEMVLITQKEGWFDTDGVSIKNLEGRIEDPTIQGRKASSRTDVTIDVLEHYAADALVGALIADQGKLNFHYGDDSTVVFAELSLTLRPKAPRHDLTGTWNGRYNWNDTGWLSGMTVCLRHDGTVVSGEYYWAGDKSGTLRAEGPVDNRLDYEYSGSDCTSTGYFDIEQDGTLLTGEYRCRDKTGRWDLERAATPSELCDTTDKTAETRQPEDDTDVDPSIDMVIVVTSQQSLRFPFHRDGSDTGNRVVKTRRLFVHGSNLQQALENGKTFRSEAPGITYAVESPTVSAGDPGLLSARVQTKGLIEAAKATPGLEPKVLESLERRRQTLDDVENLVAVSATLKPGVTPGYQAILLGKARGKWPLLFANQGARLQFNRAEDQVRSDSTQVFYPGDIGTVDIVFDADIPYSSIGVRLMQRRAAAGADAEPVVIERTLLARRLDDLLSPNGFTYRSDPIHFVSADYPRFAPPDDEKALVLDVRDGDAIGARLLEPGTVKVAPALVTAKVRGVEEGLGALWKSALEKVSQCIGRPLDAYAPDEFARMRSTQFSAIAVGELLKYPYPFAYLSAELSGAEDSPFNFNPTVDVYNGDHAAAILIRDAMIPLMRNLEPVFLPFANRPTEVRKWALATGLASELPVLSGSETKLNVYFVPTPAGSPSDFKMLEGDPVDFPGPTVVPDLVAKSRPLSEWIDRRDEILKTWPIDPAWYDAWLDRKIRARGQKLIDDLQFAVGRADRAGDCKTEELMLIAGHKSDAAVAQIVPKLVKWVAVPGKPGRTYWKPDKLARGFVERLHLAGAAVAALKAYETQDDSFKAMIVAAATAGLSRFATAFIGPSTGVAINIAGDVADAAYFGAKDLKRARESEDFYRFAEGASLVLGDDILIAAEESRESTAMALAGLVAPGLGAGLSLKDLRHFRNIDKGKALIEEKGLGILDELETLTVPEQTQVAAYLDDTFNKLSIEGFGALDETQKEAMETLRSRLLDETQDIDPSEAALGPSQSVVHDAATGTESNTFAVPPLTEGEKHLLETTTEPPFAKVEPEQLAQSRDSPYTRAQATDIDLGAASGTFDGKRVRDANGQVVAEVGKRLGKGAVSSVYPDANDGNSVVRIVELDTGDAIEAGKKKKDFMDDQVGRGLLEQAQDPSGYFRASKRHSEPVVVQNSKDGYQKYIISREENLSEMDGDKRVTNALERFFDKKGDKPARRREPTRAERLTMQLAIRELNQKGIVWTDHKYANFDIRPDKTRTSPTGYRMVIFDTGGMRPMTGKTPRDMWRNARRWQQVFDSARSMEDLKAKMRSGGKHYLDFIDPRSFANGSDAYSVSASPFANRLRGREYQRLNNLTPEQFRAELDELSRAVGRQIPYAPPQ